MKIVLAVLAAAALVGCTVQAPAAAPAPTVTVTESETTPAPVESTPANTFVLGVLQEVWDSTSIKKREALCWLYNFDDDEAWKAFNSGAEDTLDRETFDYFFSDKCGSSY